MRTGALEYGRRGTIDLPEHVQNMKMVHWLRDKGGILAINSFIVFAK